MRLACILTVLTAVALHARSTALPVVCKAITKSRDIPDVASSLPVDGERHLRRAETEESDTRVLQLHTSFICLPFFGQEFWLLDVIE